MKAIRVHEFGDPDVMRLEEAPDPVPGAGEVLVRVHAAGVNPVETYIRSGAYAARPQLPYTPGSDAAGIVAAVGEGVEGIAVNDWVYTAGSITGAYAELTLCQRADVFPLPEPVSFAQGAAIGIPYGTAWHALFNRACARPGDIVLVHGATGAVGIAAVQIAAAAGCKVVATGGSERGRKLVAEQGAVAVAGHDLVDHPDRVEALTDGRGFDVILEMLANVNLAKDLGAAAQHGRIAVIGSRGSIEIDPRQAMARELEICGVMLRALTPDQVQRVHAALRAGLTNKSLRPIADREMPLSDAPAAHRAVMEGSHYGKIVLVPGM